MQLFTDNKKIAYLGLMTALALIFSYVEALIPVNFGIPGVKLGLANIVAVIALYLFGFPAAFAVQILRILLSGFLFGNMYSIIYSLSGGLLSITCMYILKKTDIFSMLGISIAGGIIHNIGQLIVAMIVMKQIRL